MNKICCIKVNEETSPLVQELLFSYGWGWRISGKEVCFTDYQYLYLWDDKDICHSNYKDDDCVELKFAELLEYLKTGKLPKKEINICKFGLNVSILRKSTQFINSDNSLEIPNSLILEIAEKIKCF